MNAQLEPYGEILARRFTIAGNVWRNGEHLATFDLADGATHVTNQREASQLVNSYVACLLIQGGTATFSRVHDEYKVSMPDGSAEYIAYPREVSA